MYYYIVDPQKISQKEFERVQNNLYSSLSEYRISGEVVRVTGLRTIQQLVENAFAHEAKTLVAVGTDQTLHEMINAIGKREIVVGFIPIQDSEVGNIFGIKDLVQAVKTIAFRRIEEIDLGVVNNIYFLSRINFGLSENGIRDLLNLPIFEIKFSADEKYEATQNVVAGLIINARQNRDLNKIGDPTDGLLDLLLLPQISKWNAFVNRKQILSGFFEDLPLSSVLHVKNIQIKNPQGMVLKIQDKIIGHTPATISIVPGMLRMIVGKDRGF